jgi:Gliding motility associated protein GldN
MVKFKKIILAIAVLFIVCDLNAQTKKKTTTKKKPKVVVQKPSQTPEKEAPAALSSTPVETTGTPAQVPMAEREQIVIPPQPVETVPVNKSAINGAAEKVITDSLSVHPIDPSNVLYRITNWRRMDLKEKINQPFFSRNNEITKFLIDGVKSGVLIAYTNDSVSTVLSADAFAKNMLMEETGGDGLSEEEKNAGFGTVGADDGWGGSTKPSSTTPAKPGSKPAAGTDDGWGNITPAKTPATTGTPVTGTTAVAPQASTAAEYYAKDLTILEIKEDYIFDKQRSRAYNSIQTISIIIPAEKTIKGFDVPVASFRYKDLDQYFRSNPKCIWYNYQNIAQHKNMADAFDLRLFNARIIKQSNANDAFLVDLYKGEKAGLRASELLEYKLMEFEHNLWEY